MPGVDIPDQLISNYCHYLWFRRIWVSTMYHEIDLIRVNAWITHSSLVAEEILEYKGFVLVMVKYFLERSTTLSKYSTEYVHGKSGKRNEQDPIHNRGTRVNQNNPPIWLRINLKDKQLTTSWHFLWRGSPVNIAATSWYVLEIMFQLDPHPPPG